MKFSARIAITMAENDVNVVDKDGSESTASGNETQMMSAESLTKRSANEAKTKQTSTDETPLKILNGLPMMKTDEIFDHRFRVTLLISKHFLQLSPNPAVRMRHTRSYY